MPVECSRRGHVSRHQPGRFTVEKVGDADHAGRVFGKPIRQGIKTQSDGLQADLFTDDKKRDGRKLLMGRP